MMSCFGRVRVYVHYKTTESDMQSEVYPIRKLTEMDLTFKLPV
jgi:hypothetical protein